MNGKVLEKRIHVRVEHVIPSKCRIGHIARVKKNEEIKKAAKRDSDGNVLNPVSLKRSPIMPKPAYFVDYKGAEPETIQPVPFSDLM